MSHNYMTAKGITGCYGILISNSYKPSARFVAYLRPRVEVLINGYKPGTRFSYTMLAKAASVLLARARGRELIKTDAAFASMVQLIYSY